MSRMDGMTGMSGMDGMNESGGGLSVADADSTHGLSTAAEECQFWSSEVQHLDLSAFGASAGIDDGQILGG